VSLHDSMLFGILQCLLKVDVASCYFDLFITWIFLTTIQDPNVLG